MQEDNFSLLRGIGEKEIKSYGRKGIFTVTQLSYTFRPRRRPKWARAAPRPHSFALQALALRENKIYINGSPDLKKSALSIYLDIEGLPDDDFYYLIGVLIDDGATQQMHSFWADSKDEQGLVITQLVQLLTQYTDYTLYHFGNYENKALKALKSSLPDELRQPLAEIQRRAVNVLSTVHASVYVPTLSNTLKDIAGFLGFHWTDAQATGLDSIVWRSRWETTHDDSLKDRLLRYNRDDCLGLKRVTDFVTSLNREQDPERPTAPSTLPDVVNTSELQRNSGLSHRFGKISFVFPELDFVNKCAYFDYQREKVYVRTNKTLKGIQKAKRRERRRTTRPNTQIELLTKRCPFCGSKKVGSRQKSQPSCHRSEVLQQGSQEMVNEVRIKQTRMPQVRGGVRARELSDIQGEIRSRAQVLVYLSEHHRWAERHEDYQRSQGNLRVVDPEFLPSIQKIARGLLPRNLRGTSQEHPRRDINAYR